MFWYFKSFCFLFSGSILKIRVEENTNWNFNDHWFIFNLILIFLFDLHYNIDKDKLKFMFFSENLNWSINETTQNTLTNSKYHNIN
jgi:hypothetical protein